MALFTLKSRINYWYGICELLENNSIITLTCPEVFRAGPSVLELVTSWKKNNDTIPLLETVYKPNSLTCLTYKLLNNPNLINPTCYLPQRNYSISKLSFTDFPPQYNDTQPDCSLEIAFSLSVRFLCGKFSSLSSVCSRNRIVKNMKSCILLK